MKSASEQPGDQAGRRTQQQRAGQWYRPFAPEQPEAKVARQTPDAQLLQQLFSVRNAIAAKEGLARNRIFTDEQLQEMAFWRPKTKLELKRIRGIGPKKVDRYGEAIVKCIWGDRI